MKKITYFILSVTLFSLISSWGCNSGEPGPLINRVALMDSIYRNNKDSIDLFCKSLEWLNQLKELSVPLMTVDSTNANGKIKFPDIVDTAASCTDSIKLTASNLVLINNKTNMVYLGDSDTARGRINYYLTVYSPNQNQDMSFNSINFSPSYWEYYIDSTCFKKYSSPLHEEEKQGLVDTHMKEIRSISKVRYAIVLSDVIVQKPVLLSDKFFQSGGLISKVALYELASHKLICSGVLLTESSERVRNLFAGAGVNDELMKEALGSTLIEDFCNQRNERVAKFFKIGL